MKKIKNCVVIGMLMLIMFVSSGCYSKCGTNVKISMSEDGKGTFLTEIKIDKEFFNQDNCWKINGINEYVEKLKAQTDKDVSLNYKIEEFEEKKDKYYKLIISFDFNSAEEFNEILGKLEVGTRKAYNECDRSYLSEHNVDSYYRYREILDEILQKYLKDNGIKYKAKGKNYKKLLEELYRDSYYINCIEEENEKKHYLLNDFYSKENYIKICDNETEKLLIIKPYAWIALSDYLGEIHYLIANDLLDMELVGKKVKEYSYIDVSYYVNGYLNEMGVAEELKLLMDKNKKRKDKYYNLDDYDIKLIDTHNFGEYWERRFEAADFGYLDYGAWYMDNPEYWMIKLYMSAVYDSRYVFGSSGKIEYGNNVYKLNFVASNVEEYIISSIKGKKAKITYKMKEDENKEDTKKNDDKSNINNQDDNKSQDTKEDNSQLDNVPDTGDDYDVPLIIGLAGLSLICLIRLIRYIREN